MAIIHLLVDLGRSFCQFFEGKIDKIRKFTVNYVFQWFQNVKYIHSNRGMLARNPMIVDNGNVSTNTEGVEVVRFKVRRIIITRNF